ncbi:hypothetical protein Tco_1142739 [Tanacetum coccineum]
MSVHPRRRIVWRMRNYIENISYQRYSEAICTWISILNFESPEEVPTFIGDDGLGGCLSFRLLQMDLFSVVHLSKPKLVTKGVRPLRDGAGAAAGKYGGAHNDLRLEHQRLSGTDVLAPYTGCMYRSHAEPPSQTNKRWVFRGGHTLMRRANGTPPLNATGGAGRARFASEAASSVQKEEEILLLKTTVCRAQAEAESSRSYAQKLAEEKMVLLVKAEQERADAAEYKASCHWAVKYLEGEVKQSFGDVVKYALARGKAEAVEELHEKKLLTVPAAQVPRYNHNAYEELVAAMEAMKLLELPHIAQLERDQDYPIAGRGATARYLSLPVLVTSLSFCTERRSADGVLEATPKAWKKKG